MENTNRTVERTGDEPLGRDSPKGGGVPELHFDSKDGSNWIDELSHRVNASRHPVTGQVFLDKALES
mgnify:CR=1 FL=1